MKIKNRQQLLVIVAGLTLALLLGDRLVVSPLARSWNVRSDRIAQLRNLAKEYAPLRNALTTEADLMLTPVATPTLSVVERAA